MDDLRAVKGIAFGILVSLILWAGIFAAFAQQPDDDAYWQQLVASKEAQSSQHIVRLAKQLEAATRQIAALQKQLDELKEKEKTK